MTDNQGPKEVSRHISPLELPNGETVQVKTVRRGEVEDGVVSLQVLTDIDFTTSCKDIGGAVAAANGLLSESTVDAAFKECARPPANRAPVMIIGEQIKDKGYSRLDGLSVSLGEVIPSPDDKMRIAEIRGGNISAGCSDLDSPVMSLIASPTERSDMKALCTNAPAKPKNPAP